MRRFMNYMMLSCKKATELIEKKQVVKLSAKETIQMKMHTTVCEACRSYQNQSFLLEKALDQWFQSRKQHEAKLSESVKDHILLQLKNTDIH